MNYRRLGRAGMSVSEISLGTWITAGNQLDEADAAAVIRKAWDLGIDTFDTADGYAAGRAEEILGRAVADLPRERLVICTKGFVRMWEGSNGRGASRKHLLTAVEHSLRRLKMDYVDLYQVHAWDAATPLEETLIALDDIVRQGKALHVGCSNWSGAQLTEALTLRDRLGLLSRIDSIQPCYNMLRREFAADALPVCRDRGVGVIVYSPLCQGVLTGKYNDGKVPAGSRGEKHMNVRERYLNRENLARLAELGRIARARKCTMAQLALAWVLRDPAVSSAIVGASRPEQLVENVKAIDLPLGDEEVARIEQALTEPQPRRTASRASAKRPGRASKK